jgi:hypothetical protein
MEHVKNAYKLLVGKPEGKRPLGVRPTSENDIKLSFKEIWLKVVDCIQGPLAGCCERGSEHSGSIKCC